MNNKNLINDKNLEIKRHSLAHIMAAAILELFPEASFGIGPTIQNGFYYDFILPKKITDTDLLKIEKKMRELISKNLTFEKREVSLNEAKKIFSDLKQQFKVELINDLEKYGTTEEDKIRENEKKEKVDKVSIYQTGKFIDLCRGPHVKTTKEINPDSFKLEKIAGAYWRGNEKNPMLTRIYGLAFNNKKELDEYLNKVKEAEKRDHRKLGQELDLYSIHEEFGPGLVYWHPKGGRIRVIMEDFWRQEHYKNGYEIVFTPHIGKSTLWEISGHLGFYKENMYSPIEIDENEYYVKPMNCPFHIQIYKSKVRSYRDLPLRWAELGTVYRYEKAGVLNGLLRVRGFTQDDAHLICTPEQMPVEIEKVLKFSLFILKSFGFTDFSLYLSTKPKKSVGDLKMWEEATKALENALKKLKMDYARDEGGGAFYGPKIDIKIKDALGREWQCTTIQFDFNMPERFQMEYIAEDGKPHRPYMIHRALMGSLERFFGTMIEHYAGAFPLWLAPVQVAVLPISKKHKKYGKEIYNMLLTNNIRAEFLDSNDTVSKKIREAEMQKTPYILVVGDKEVKTKSVAVRQRGRGDIGAVKIKKFIDRVLDKIENKSLML